MALEEFKNAGLQDGIELAEWFINNEHMLDGIIKIVEYEGGIPWEGSTEIAKVEDDRYLFIAYFKACKSKLAIEKA